jgi:hypothetical protein
MRKADLLRAAAYRARDPQFQALWLEHARALERKASNLTIYEAIGEVAE